MKKHDSTARPQNLVAKHAPTFNKSNVMVDRKRRQKSGYNKHKGKSYE